MRLKNNQKFLKKICEHKNFLELIGPKRIIIHDPESTYADERIKIGEETVIWPNVYILGKAKIGKRCKILPGTFIVDSEIGDDVSIGPNYLIEDSKIKNRAYIGCPSAIRRSVIGKGAKVPHHSYIGDAKVGNEANIGAGTITCNYDGLKKNKTTIGNKAFIGCNSLLVAPVEIGKGSIIGAGTVVTRDVPPNSLVIRRIRKQTNMPNKVKKIKEGWKIKKSKKSGE